MLVQTTKGLIPREQLEVVDIVEEMDEHNVRKTRTEWRMNGELVRADVNVNVLCGQAIFGEQEKIA